MSAEPVAWTCPSWLLNPHGGQFSRKPTPSFPLRLYDQAGLDAAVVAARAEERERCETLARYALDAATEGNWAYAAVLLQRIKGEPSGSDAAAIRNLKPEGE